MLCGNRLAFLERSITMQIIFTSATESWRTLKSEMWSKYRCSAWHWDLVKDSDATLSVCFPSAALSLCCSLLCTHDRLLAYILSPKHAAPLLNDMVCWMKQAGRHQGHLLKVEISKFKLWVQFLFESQCSKITHTEIWTQYNWDIFSQMQQK